MFTKQTAPTIAGRSNLDWKGLPMAGAELPLSDHGIHPMDRPRSGYDEDEEEEATEEDDDDLDDDDEFDDDDDDDDDDDGLEYDDDDE